MSGAASARGLLLTATLWLALAAPSLGAAERTLLVLDASGSMWGQIDGRAKLEIARETLGGALASLPPEHEIGLIAYGHRRKGDCQDIELLVPPGAGQGPRIQAAVAELRFLGMTPLTAAVQQAAQALRYTEQRAQVVLITDGVETCDADPCALGEALAQSGVDFTAHVVGFGLSAEEGRQVACLAEATGGRYLQANDLAALQDALQQTVVAPPPPPPLPEAALEAPAQAETASRIEVRWQGPGAALDDLQLFDPAAADGSGRVVRSQRLNQDSGFERQGASLVMAATPGRYELRYWHGEQRRVLARQPIELVAAAVSLQAPAQAPIGSLLTVRWAGPGAALDDLEVVDPSSGKLLRRQRLNQDRGFEQRQATLQLPSTPGSYLLRYFNGENREVLAEQPIEVLAAEVSLSAPAQVEMGRPFQVQWQGPGAGLDDVELTRPGEDRVLRRKRLNQDRGFEQRQATLSAPVDPGRYELRYWSGADRSVLATRSIEVIAIPLSLQAPAEVDAGASFVVQWQGPGAIRDDIEIHDPASGKVVRRQRLNQDRGFDRNEATLKAPEQPGQYLLRYWNGESSQVLTERELRVR